jgi:hypothetical protein
VVRYTDQGRHRRLRRPRDRRRCRARALRRPHRHVRQRRHPVVREADADPTDLPRARRRDGRQRRVAAGPAAVEGGRRARPPLARRGDHEAPRRRRQRRELLGGVVASTAGITVEEHADSTDAFVARATHPTNGRLFRDCAYLPMVELLRYLEANGFSTFIASGGDRDFMRPFADEPLRDPGRAGHLFLRRAALRRRRRDPRLPRRARRLRRRPGEGGRAPGAASGAVRSSPAATPTATSRCCASPADRRCGS